MTRWTLLALLLTTAPLAAVTAAPAVAAPTCDGRAATISGAGDLVGTSGADVIVATDKTATVRAGGGDDVVCGSLHVFGGRGADRILFDGHVTWRDTIYIEAGAGDDLIRFDGDQESPAAGTREGIYAGSGDDTVIGSDGMLWFFGGPGDDRLVARGGGDLMDGGPGDDLLLGGPGQEIAAGGTGNDVLRGRGAQDELAGGPGRDEAWGGGDTDVCYDNEVQHSCEADDWV
ncbi:calcium-binding protein [Nocardioides anomalus]|uniref:Calcium-binding protein n=1 Tax=Nocardioides anomalus TaxID=2712223 RepID=A0A6G6WCG5_9ACTN|nr:calcium-binding protein [Nocardioides anomalus]QIG42909.1 calcium-binding protein [Nocardioides anomalus]